MKNKAIAISLLFLSSCVGNQSDGFGSVVATYVTLVQPVLLIGIGAEQDAGRLSPEDAQACRLAASEIGTLLEGGNLSQAGIVRAAWERLLPFAFLGVDAQIAKGEIGPGVGASLKESLRLFGERLIKLQEQPPA